MPHRNPGAIQIRFVVETNLQPKLFQEQFQGLCFCSGINQRLSFEGELKCMSPKMQIIPAFFGASDISV
jgi:hypothetical protein